MGERSPFGAIGALLGLTGVAFGAFGAHGLRARVDARALEVFETAARYHLIHALALVLVGLAATRTQVGQRALSLAGWWFVLGVVLFSGSLYAYVLSGDPRLARITPVGGLFFMGGWAAFAWALWPRKPRGA